MQVSVENTSTLGRVMKVIVPALVVENEVKVKFNELAKRARIDGFRPGKVPKSVLQKRFGAEVRGDTIKKIINDTMQEAVTEQAIKTVGVPMLDSVTAEPGADLEYVVNFEVYPEIKLMDFSLLNIEKPSVNILDADIEKEIVKLREQFAVFTEDAKHQSKTGDKITLYYNSTIDGKPYEHSDSEEFAVILGSNQLLADFEKNLLGIRAGEEKNFNFTYPKDWRIAEIENKSAQFTVHVVKVERRELAEIDAEFAKKINAESHDLDVIRAKVRVNLERNVHSIIDDIVKENITEKLFENLNFELPKTLVDLEIEALHKDLHAKHDGDQHNHDCHHTGLEDDARRRVALSLILREVISQESIKTDKERVRARFNSFARMFNNAEFLDHMYSQSNELLAKIENSVLIDQALDFVASKVAYSNKECALQEILMRKSAAGTV